MSLKFEPGEHSMATRPWQVSLIGWLFIAAGIFGFVYHATEFGKEGQLHLGVVWVLVVRLLAVVGGAFLLRGANWSRWLVLAWLVYHVILSALHSLTEFGFHVVILAVIVFLLFRGHVSAYFQKAQ